MTSAANPHYQKHFDRLFDLAKAGDWDGVRNYEVKGSNSYPKSGSWLGCPLVGVGWDNRGLRFRPG